MPDQGERMKKGGVWIGITPSFYLFSSFCTIMSLVGMLKHGALRIRDDRPFSSLSLHFNQS